MSDAKKHRLVIYGGDLVYRLTLSRPHRPLVNFLSVPFELVIWTDGFGAVSLGRAPQGSDPRTRLLQRVLWAAEKSLPCLLDAWQPGSNEDGRTWCEDTAARELDEYVERWDLEAEGVEAVKGSLTNPDAARVELMSWWPDLFEVVDRWGMAPSAHARIVHQACQDAAALVQTLYEGSDLVESRFKAMLF